MLCELKLKLCCLKTMLPKTSKFKKVKIYVTGCKFTSPGQPNINMVKEKLVRLWYALFYVGFKRSGNIPEREM